MLSQNSLDRLIMPIIERQESINTFVIKSIAERVRDIGTLLPSDVYKLEQLYKTGSDVQLINKEIARLTGLQIIDIKKLIKVIATDAYHDAKPYYNYANRPFIDYDSNIELQRVVKAIEEQTLGEFINISRAQAFMLRDPITKKLVPTPMANTYQKVVDTAIQAVSGGITDYNTAIRQTMKELNQSGLRAIYETESGRIYSQRLDTAVRRNILDGVRAINQGVQNEVGKQFGADGIELTVHAYPALDHAPVQGHQFTHAEFEKMQNGEDFVDVQGKHYTGFDRAIGTLNCRHFAYSIIVGVAKQNYTNKQLQNIIDRNEIGYTLPNGKHLTMYECTQKQRELETKIRYAKDGQIMARTMGDRTLAEFYQSQINKYTNEYNSFSNACGLERMVKKMTVSGYRPIKITK